MSCASPLNDALLKASARKDATALASLYEQAAASVTDLSERRFFLTHAYIHALEAGADSVPRLRRELVDLGAEAGEETLSNI